MIKPLTIVLLASAALFTWMSFSVATTQMGMALDEMTPGCQTVCLQSAIEQSGISIVATEMIVFGFIVAAAFFFRITENRLIQRAVAVRAGPDPFRLRGIIKRE